MELNAIPLRSYENLRVFRFARALATDLFWLTRHFPDQEKYALTDQLRRTARSIADSVRMCWSRRYSAREFRHHLDDAQALCANLGLWLDFAYDNRYVSREKYEEMHTRVRTLQRMLARLQEQRIAHLA